MVTVTCTLTHEWGHSESTVSLTAPRDESRQQEQHPTGRLDPHVPCNATPCWRLQGWRRTSRTPPARAPPPDASQPQPRQQARPRQPRREAAKRESVDNSTSEFDAPAVEAPAELEQHITTAESCTCADFQYRGKERPCKHITRLASAERASSVLQGQRDRLKTAVQRWRDTLAEDAGRAAVDNYVQQSGLHRGSTA